MRNQWLVGVFAVSALSVSAPAPASAQSSPSESHYQPMSFDLGKYSASAREDSSDEGAGEGQSFQRSRQDDAALRLQKMRSEAHRWELAYLTLSAIDAAQTISCLKKETCEEANPLFGKNPSTKTILIAKLGAGLAHYALFSHLNKRNPRSARLAAQIGVGLQGTVVMLNASSGF